MLTQEGACAAGSRGAAFGPEAPLKLTSDADACADLDAACRLRRGACDSEALVLIDSGC